MREQRETTPRPRERPKNFNPIVNINIKRKSHVLKLNTEVKSPLTNESPIPPSQQQKLTKPPEPKNRKK